MTVKLQRCRGVCFAYLGHAGRHLKRRKELGPSVFSLNDRKSKCPIPTGWKIQIVDDDGDPTDPNEYLVECGEVGLQNFLWRKVVLPGDSQLIQN